MSALLATSVGILVIPVSLQIFSRFTDLLPHYIWTEELARFMFVWMVMLGAALGVREKAHFDVDLWPEMAPRANAGVKLVASAAILVMSLVFIWAGIAFTRFAWNRTSELADLPLWLIHIAWPITGLLWLIFQGEHVLNEIRIIFGSAARSAK